MFAWEIGAFATILAAIMAVLVAVALTRAAEDDGTLELLRSCGVDPASRSAARWPSWPVRPASSPSAVAPGRGLAVGMSTESPGPGP